MSPTRIARSAKPPSVIGAGNIYFGVSFFLPLIIFNLGLAAAFSKAAEILNSEKVPTKIPGPATFIKSVLPQTISAVVGGAIMKPVRWLITEPSRNLLGAFASARKELYFGRDDQDVKSSEQRELDFRHDHQDVKSSPGGAVALTSCAQLSAQQARGFSCLAQPNLQSQC